MDIINAYFDGIIFTKIEQKEGITIYAAALSSPFGDGRKTYALAIVPVHTALLTQAELKDLHWQNFQTRTLTNGWNIQNQKWDVKRLPRGLQMLMFEILKTGDARNEARTKYTCETVENLEMLLYHDPKKKSIYQHGNRINLLAALATFKCVLNFTGIQTQKPVGVENVVFQDRKGTNASSGLRYENDFDRSRQRLNVATVPIASLAVRVPRSDARPDVRYPDARPGKGESVSSSPALPIIHTPNRLNPNYPGANRNPGYGEYNLGGPGPLIPKGQEQSMGKYTNLSLSIDMPDGLNRPGEEYSEYPSPEYPSSGYQNNQGYGQEHIDDSFELL